MKSSPSIYYVVSVKSTVKISSIFVAFLENMNFITIYQRYTNGSSMHHFSKADSLINYLLVSSYL